MKNLVLGLFVLGLTSLGFSQNTNSETQDVQLEDVVISNINLSYLEKVQDIGLADYVKFLEKEASVFDVRGFVELDSRKRTFIVMFKSAKGYIIADYDRNGKILKTSERYKNIALPKNLIIAVFKKYPESSLLKVAYSVEYDYQKAVKKTYKIQIMNNGKKRNLKIRSGDNFNNALTIN